MVTFDQWESETDKILSCEMFFKHVHYWMTKIGHKWGLNPESSVPTLEEIKEFVKNLLKSAMRSWYQDQESYLEISSGGIVIQAKEADNESLELNVLYSPKLAIVWTLENQENSSAYFLGGIAIK